MIVSIGKRKIGSGRPAYIIFEVASTHENNWQVAKSYIYQARDIGADAIKFQLFRTDRLVNPLTVPLKKTADYFKKSELSPNWIPKLKKLCDKVGIDFLCTPFDSVSAKILHKAGAPAIKIASGDLTNPELLKEVAGYKKPIILATGMTTLSEINWAVNLIRRHGNAPIILLQAVSVYPTSFADANVSAMRQLERKFSSLAGYSDNGSKGFLVPLLAVALGASVIEKHVTAKKERKSIDDKFSLTVAEFKEMIKKIRQLEKLKSKDLMLAQLKKEYKKDFKLALGDGKKKPAPYGTRIAYPGVKGSFVQKEADERHWARRGVYLREDLSEGQKIKEESLIFLRPDIGISAIDYKKILGKTAGENLKAGQPLKVSGNCLVAFHLDDARKQYGGLEDKQFLKTLLKYATFQ